MLARYRNMKINFSLYHSVMFCKNIALKSSLSKPNFQRSFKNMLFWKTSEIFQNSARGGVLFK